MTRLRGIPDIERNVEFTATFECPHCHAVTSPKFDRFDIDVYCYSSGYGSYSEETVDLTLRCTECGKESNIIIR